MKQQFERKENLNKQEFIALLEKLEVDIIIIDYIKSLPDSMDEFGTKYEFNANVVVFTIGNGFCNYDINYVDAEGKELFKKRIFTKPYEMVKYFVNYIKS